jgi:hypothetical protein
MEKLSTLLWQAVAWLQLPRSRMRDSKPVYTLEDVQTSLNMVSHIP